MTPETTALAATLPSAAAPERKALFWSAGGILAALASTSCCILPFAFFTLGVSGAWIRYLTQLAPYQPIFITLSLAAMAAGVWSLQRRRQQVCEPGSYCASPTSGRLARIMLWGASLLVLAALAFPYVFRLFIPN